MAEPNRRKALVFVHPLAPVCCAPSLAWIQPALFEFTQDTNRCVFSPLFTGTLARFPDVRFIFCHSGAAVPVLAGRAAALGFDREFADKMPNGIDYELRKLHYDVALQANRPALAAVFAYVPTTALFNALGPSACAFIVIARIYSVVFGHNAGAGGARQTSAHRICDVCQFIGVGVHTVSTYR